MNDFVKRFTLFFFLTTLLTGCDYELARDLSAKDANRVVTIMAQAGIDVRQSVQSGGTVKLSVDRTQQRDAIRLLTTYRLLPERLNDKESDSFFPSPGEQKRKLETELTHRIEDTLKSFSGLLDIRIFFHSPDEEGQTEKRSASVIVQAAENFTLPIADIQRLISGASGITAAKIEVLIKKEILAPHEAISRTELQLPDVTKQRVNQVVRSFSSFTLSADAEPFFAALMLIVGFVCIWRYRKSNTAVATNEF